MFFGVGRAVCVFLWSKAVFLEGVLRVRHAIPVPSPFKGAAWGVSPPFPPFFVHLVFPRGEEVAIFPVRAVRGVRPYLFFVARVNFVKARPGKGEFRFARCEGGLSIGGVGVLFGALLLSDAVGFEGVLTGQAVHRSVPVDSFKAIVRCYLVHDLILYSVDDHAREDGRLLRRFQFRHYESSFLLWCGSSFYPTGEERNVDLWETFSVSGLLRRPPVLRGTGEGSLVCSKRHF